MNNIWFYTLSSISQVLAATMGVFAVFVIFKLDKINEVIDEYKKFTFRAIPIEDKKNSYNYYELEIDKIIEMGEKFIKSEDFKNQAFGGNNEVGSFVFGENTILLLKKLISKKENIINKLKINLITSILTISASLFLLVFTQIFSEKNYLIVLSIVLFGAISSLFYIGDSTYKIFKND